MSELALLVAGTGHWGNEWLRVLAQQDGVTIAATAGRRDPELPDGLRLAPGYRHFGSYEEAIGAVDADAMLVTLPARLHTDALLRGIDAGLHVLCEKPLAETPDEVERLLAAAAERPDLVLAVSQNYRWRPWAQAARAAIEDGTTGPIHHVSLRFSQPEMLAGARLEQDNPLLQDMAIHHFDLMRFLTGRDAVELFAREHAPSWNRYAGRPALDLIVVMEDGVHVTYSGTWAGRGGATTWDGDWTIEGERGLLTVVDGRVALLPDAGTADPSGKGTIEAPDPIEIPLPEAAGDLESSLNDFRRAIAESTEPATGIRDNARSLAIAFAIEESIRARGPVEVRTWADANATAGG